MLCKNNEKFYYCFTASNHKKHPSKFLATKKRQDRVQEILKSDGFGSKRWLFYPRVKTQAESPTAAPVPGIRDNVDQRVKVRKTIITSCCHTCEKLTTWVQYGLVIAHVFNFEVIWLAGFLAIFSIAALRAAVMKYLLKVMWQAIYFWTWPCYERLQFLRSRHENWS